MEDPDVKPKTKRKYTDVRRRKAKEAARNRRDVEAEVYQSLISLLPVDPNIIKHNYCQALRISVAFIHLCRDISHSESEDSKSLVKLCPSTVPSIHDALHGFFIIVSSNGIVIFVTESIFNYLGIPQSTLIGSSIYDFIHPCDIKPLRSILTSNRVECKKIRFLCRVKCTVTDRGTKLNIKAAPFKMIQFIGCHLRISDRVYAMAVCEPLQHPSNIEVPLDRGSFLSRHDPSMIFTYCDDNMKNLVGFTNGDILGRSVYEYHHACDHHILYKAHQDLFNKGQCVSDEYRFLVKHGGYVQMISHSTVIYDESSEQPRCVVSIYFVLSGIQRRDLILSHVQVPPPKPSTNHSSDNKRLTNINAQDKENKCGNIQVTPKESTKPKMSDQSTKELLAKKKLALRAPSLPKGRDVKLLSKIPKFGIFGGMKLPIGSTESVIMRTNDIFSLQADDDDDDDDDSHVDISPPPTPPCNDLNTCPIVRRVVHQLPSDIEHGMIPSNDLDLPHSLRLPDGPFDRDISISHNSVFNQSQYNQVNNLHDTVKHNRDLDLAIGIPDFLPTTIMPGLDLSPMSSGIFSPNMPHTNSSPRSNISEPRSVTSDFYSSPARHDLCDDIQFDTHPDMQRSSTVKLSDTALHQTTSDASLLKQLFMYGTEPSPSSTDVTSTMLAANRGPTYPDLSPTDFDRFTPTAWETLLYGQQLLDALDTK